MEGQLLERKKGRAQGLKQSWENILLEEFFLFSGGRDWRKAGRGPKQPTDYRHRENGRDGVLLEGGRVVGLLLAYNGFAGVLSPSCGLLSKLRVLDLSGNLLKGTLDPLFALRNIEVIDLSSNVLSGSIAEAIGSLSTLKQLFLSENRLTGSIPGSLSSLGGLSVLCLDGNALSGALSPGIGSMPKLTVLALQDNKLNGPIPDLRGLTALRSLDLSRNRFEGKAPSLSTLSGLRVFACQGPGYGKGRLSGGLSSLLNTKTSGSVMQLVRLDLSSHVLSGDLPLGLRALHLLEILIICENNLKGLLPEWLGELGFLRYVDLSVNLLQGPVPVSLAGLPHLETLLLQDNALDGELPLGFATALQSRGIRRFTFDGHRKRRGRARRATVVETYRSPPTGSSKQGEKACSGFLVRPLEDSEKNDEHRVESNTLINERTSGTSLATSTDEERESPPTRRRDTELF